MVKLVAQEGEESADFEGESPSSEEIRRGAGREGRSTVKGA